MKMETKYLLYKYTIQRQIQGLEITEFLDCPLSSILKNKTFWKLDLFPFYGERIEGTYSTGSA
jgi:hypothetical protein